MASTDNSKFFIPGAIIIAGLIVAGTLIYVNKDKSGVATGPTEQALELPVQPIGTEDNIQGNADADIVIVEYSDFECPYCASFHPTMERIMDEYGAQGKVAWVYRHFPLRSIHPRAQYAAEASECVADLGGNDAFWSFTKKVFDGRQPYLEAIQNNPQDPRIPTLHEESLADATLLRYATESGIDGTAYNTCLSEGRFTAKVNADYENGLEIAQIDQNFGTPYSVIVTKDGAVASIPGAQPYSVVKQIIDTVLAK